MGGSKKGERRGNARKRPAKQRLSYSGAYKRKQRRHHETPGEIMREAVQKHHGSNRLETVVVERRIQIARIINGLSDAVEDVTPKEALLKGMQHNLQAIRDWEAMLEFWAAQTPTPELTANVDIAEREIERLWDKVGEFAFKVAGFIHPKLQAIAVNANTNVPQGSILQELFDEIDERERAKPIPVEHKPQRAG
jgi:hypothetical protein